uniref:Uncharacterized protein n=1 Tax=Anguilla anguilla TaxID=7936 RepID=A0A0E9VVY4_ANGAN
MASSSSSSHLRSAASRSKGFSINAVTGLVFLEPF